MTYKIQRKLINNLAWIDMPSYFDRETLAQAQKFVAESHNDPYRNCEYRVKPATPSQLEQKLSELRQEVTETEKEIETAKQLEHANRLDRYKALEKYFINTPYPGSYFYPKQDTYKKEEIKLYISAVKDSDQTASKLSEQGPSFKLIVSLLEKLSNKEV